MKNTVLFIALIIMIFLLQGFLRADEIVVKSGNVFTGQIINMTKNSIEIRTEKNTIKINTSDIKTIKLGDLKDDKENDDKNIFPSWDEPAVKTIEPESPGESTEKNDTTIQSEKQSKKRRKSYTQEVMIPKGLIVPISFKQSVRSKNYDAGDMAAIRVVEDVYIDDVLVFKKGSSGIARIMKSKNQRFFARTGIIEINDGEINDKFGNPHNVEIKIKKTGKSVTDSGTVVTIKKNDWPFSFFNVTKGKDVQISSGAVFHAIITQDSVIKVKSYK